MGFDVKIIHQSVQTICSHASHCHHFHYYDYCNVDFMLFHNVTCYIEYLLSHNHVNIANLLNITCTLVAICMILGRLECIFTSLVLILLSVSNCWIKSTAWKVFLVKQNIIMVSEDLHLSHLGLVGVPSLKSLEVKPCNLNHWEHESWDSPLHMGSQVLNPKYDTYAHTAKLFEGDGWDLCWELSRAKS